MSFQQRKAVRIVAPGPKGYGTQVIDAETNRAIPHVRHIEINIPVDDMITANVELLVGGFDVNAEATIKYVGHCPKCDELVELKRDE